MEAEMKPTVASEIALPERPDHVIVTLDDLRTTEGAPVLVRCDRCDPLVVLEKYGLPGASQNGADSASPAARMILVRRALTESSDLIHTLTSFATHDGGEVRPAFHFDDAHSVPGSVPWERVSIGDRLRVVNSIFRLSGFGGAAAAEFPAQG